ncbi:MAG: flagellar hook-length control protein FliK [Bacillota bacterium]
MFFNPLFLQVINSQESLGTQKTPKLNGSSYLFSDIIKVCFDKTDPEMFASSGAAFSGSIMTGLENAGSNVNSTSVNQNAGFNSAELTLFKLLQQVLPQKFNAGETLGEQFSGTFTSQNSNVNSQLTLSETEVTALISKLLNNDFKGKINVISGKNDQNKSNSDQASVIEESSISPDELLAILKGGNAISLESSDAENNQGLLISLVEIKSQTNNASASSEAEKTSNPEGEIKISEAKSSSSEITGTNNLSLQIGTAQGLPGIEPSLIQVQSAEEMTNGEINQAGRSLYQVELSFVSDNGSTGLQYAFNNFSEPNTNELQELANNKAIKLQDVSSSAQVSSAQVSSAQVYDSENEQPIAVTTEGENIQGIKQDQKAASSSVQSGTAQIKQTESVSEQAKSGDKASGLKQVINNQGAAGDNISADNITLTGRLDTADNKIFAENKEPVRNKGFENLSANKTADNSEGNSINNVFSSKKVFQSSTVNIVNSAESGDKTKNENGMNAGLKPEIKADELKSDGIKTDGIRSDGIKSTEASSAEKQAISSEISTKEAKAGANKNVSEQEVIRSDNSESSEQKQDVKTDGQKQSNAKTDELIIPVQNKRSGLLKDIDLSVKASRIQKDEKEKVSGEEKIDPKTNQFRSSSELKSPGEDQPGSSNKAHGKNKEEDAIKEIEKPVIKPQSEAVSSPKESSVSGIGQSEDKAGAEAFRNSDSNNQSNNSSKEHEKQSGNVSQQEQSNSQDKTEFKTKLQEGHISGNDFSKQTDNSIKEKFSTESGSFNNPLKTVKAAEVMKEISKFIEQGNGAHSLTLKIDPESLGTVKIALDVIDKLVHAKIEVENEAAKKMVENNLNQLYNSLNQNGIQLSSLNISLASYEQQKQGKANSPKKKIITQNEEAGASEAEINESRKMGYNTYEYLI